MSEEILFTDLSPPPSSSTALTPLAALADIPEEDLWLAKQKGNVPAARTNSTCSISCAR